MTSKRSAGILAPVFALRHDHDFGVGDTRALRELMDWAAEHGIGFVQLLPINETGPDNSPYNAISSVALDPVLLEISLYTLGIKRIAIGNLLPALAIAPIAVGLLS